MKITRLFILSLFTIAFLAVSGPLVAHHSLSWADNEHPITVSGTAVEFVFANLHSQIWFDNKDKDGNVVHWMIEIGGPPGLHRAEWTSESIQAGDAITVTGGQAKDGRNIINITGELLVNGKELSTRAQ